MRHSRSGDDNVEPIWDHTPIRLEPLQLALAECEAFPREALRRPPFALADSSSGALLARAATTLLVRDALLQCSWAEPASWGPIIAVVDSVVSFELQQSCDELVAARRELKDFQATLLGRVSAALEANRSKRVAQARPGGNSSWSHAELDATPLRTAAANLDSFPRAPEGAATLLQQAAAMVAIREALMVARGGDAASWGAIASALNSVSDSTVTVRRTNTTFGLYPVGWHSG